MTKKFKVGDYVTCISAEKMNWNEISTGTEYEVLGVDNGIIDMIIIISDTGRENKFFSYRFKHSRKEKIRKLISEI